MKVLLAVSGGIDSMCMADMFCRAGGDFAVAHCNFHLRGEDSDADAELVESWARSHGVRFFRADFDTAAYAAENGVSIEMAARELRYAWFARVASENGFDAVAVAHNANDNAETLILNLLRGTGLRGITGMSASRPLSGEHCPQVKPENATTCGKCPQVTPDDSPGSCAPKICATLGNMRGGDPLLAMGGAERSEAICGTQLPREEIRLIRPMLGMSRADIEAYAKEHGVEYREDRTNAENDAQRNRIRNEVFPEFAKINPSFVRTLNADMEHFAQAEAIVDDYFREAEDKILTDNKINVEGLLALKHWKYVLFRILEPLGFHADTIGAVQKLLEDRAAGAEGTFAGKRFHSPTHVLETSSASIGIRPREAAALADGTVTVGGPGTYVLGGRTVRIELLPHIPGTMLKQPAGTLICDAAALPFPFTLRGWQAGDWMRPFGMEGRAKKLSDLFTDNKLSLTEKDAAIVVASPALDKDGSHVAAVAGLRMDEALRVAKGSVQIVRITVL